MVFGWRMVAIPLRNSGPTAASSRAFARDRALLGAVAALTVVAALLRFYRLGHQGFWFDEADTAFVVSFSPGKMLGLIPQTESTPPLYYCVAWVWARLFGAHEAGLRSLSALAGVMLVPVAYGATAKLLTRRAGLTVAALTASNPLLIWYSQEARSYELLALLCALALLAFVYARATPSPRLLGAWVLACALALATHYYAVVAVAPQAIWLLAEHRRVRAVQIAVGVVALCGLALVPLAISQTATGNDSWIAHSPFGLRLAQIIPQFLIGTGAPARKLLKFTAMALVLIALALVIASGRRVQRPALVAGWLGLSGFLLSLAFVAAGSDALITRNIIALWLPAAILVAAGLSAARPRLLGAAVSLALCAIGLTAALGVAFDYNLQRPDWRSVARLLGTEPAAAVAASSAATAQPAAAAVAGSAATAQPAAAAIAGSAATGLLDGRAILIQHYRTLLPLSLYLSHLQLFPRHAERVRELDVISMTSPQQPLCWWGAACNLIPSQMQRSYPIAGFHELWVRHVHQFTIMRLLADDPVALTRGAVSRVLHTTTLRNDDLLIQRP
jgi:4-amino-4-deoxy-L-arabinose transferase-like glycosyltransferase